MTSGQARIHHSYSLLAGVRRMASDYIPLEVREKQWTAIPLLFPHSISDQNGQNLYSG